ncbi:RNA polymerase sigma factor region1.1 domain-containing protein [Methylobacterium sp. JK268]
MQPAIDRATLDRLIARGRAQGQLTTADLRGELPISGMSPDTIALVLIELEEAGIPVELEEDLLGPGRGLGAAPPPGLVLPTHDPGGGAPGAAAEGGTGPGAAPRPPARPEPASPREVPADRAIALAGVAAIALGLLIAASLTH